MFKAGAVPILKATFAVVAWGISFVATKVALRDVSPVTIVWLRFSMGVVILGAAVLARRQITRLSARDAAYFALLGFLGVTFHQWLQSTGLTTAQATTTAWIVATTPVFMAVLGWLVLKERLSVFQALGIFVAASGVLLVVSKGDFSALSAGNFGTPGDFLILISAPNWAVFSTLSRKGLSQHPAARMMFFVMGFGLLFTSVLLLAGPGFGEIARLTRDGWSGVGFLGVFCSGLAYVFWYDALQALPVAQVGAFVYIEPFVTVIVAALILNEPLLLSSLLGGIAILFGVWLVNRPMESWAQHVGHAKRFDFRIKKGKESPIMKHESELPVVGAIEAGGTKFVCAVGSGPQDIRAEARFLTGSPEETLEKVIAFFRDQQAREKLAAIGLGSFGPLDPNPRSPTYGYITSTPKPGWMQTDIAGFFQRELGLPVGFDTDVNAAALGEYRWGAAQGVDTFIYLTIGTGIGGGAIINGSLLHGLITPEMGHIQLPHDRQADPFPGICPFHADCFEGLASGPAMASRWGQSAETLPQEHSAWELEANYIALALANYACTLSPERMILGGGVMNQAHLFPLIRRRFREILNGYIVSKAVSEEIDRYIVPPGLGGRSGVMGAIALAQMAYSPAS